MTNTLTPNLELSKADIGTSEPISRTTHFNNNWDKIEQVLGLLNRIDDWTSFALSWTATTTNPVIGNGTIAAKSRRSGSLAVVRFQIDMGSTTTFGTGFYRFGGFPYNRAGTIADVGLVLTLDASTGNFEVGTAHWISATQIEVSSDTGALMAPTIPMAWAVSDRISAMLVYEVDPLAA